MSEKDNLYILLGLDPDTKDATVLEKEIKAKLVEWSAVRGPDQLKFDEARKVISRYRSQVGDLTFLDKQATEAKSLCAERQRATIDKLHDLVEIVRANGFYSDVDIAATAKSLAGAYTEDQIEQEFKKSGIKKASAKPGERPKRQTLDRTRFAEIKLQLDLAGSRNLYDFLECQHDDSSAALIARATEVDAENRKKPKTNAVTASLALVGHCKVIFGNPAERERYDNSLAFQEMSQFDHLIEQAGSDEVISFAEYHLLIGKAGSQGVSTEIAHEYISDFARRKGWNSIDDYEIALKTAGPTGGATTQTTLPTFSFLGKRFADKESLAQALSENWDDAVELYKTRGAELLNWLKHDLGCTSEAREIGRLQALHDISDDGVMLGLLQILSTKLAPVFRSTKLTRENLVELANRAPADAGAGDILRELLRSGLHEMGPVLSRAKWLITIAQSWQRATGDYEILRRRIGARAEVADLDDPKFSPSLLILLIAASTPGSTSVDALKVAANRALTADACECRWLADFGDPETAPPAALLIIQQAAPAAAAETVARRAKEAQLAREEQYELNVTTFGVIAGLSIGAALGIVAGLITISAIGWIVAIGSAIYFVPKTKGWVANPSKDPEAARNVGLALISSAAGVGVITGILVLGRSSSPASRTVPSSRVQAPISTESTQQSAIRLTRVVIAESIEDGRPVHPLTTFEAPATPAIFITYANARPNQDKLSVSVWRAGERMSYCDSTTLESQTGYFSCTLSSPPLGAGKYVLNVDLNGKPYSNYSINVVRPAVARSPSPAPSKAPEPSSEDNGRGPTSQPEANEISGVPSVVNSSTLSISGNTIHLAGIIGLSGKYAQQMADFIREQGSSVTCRRGDGGYTCLTPSGIDLAGVALANGAARVSSNAPSQYEREEQNARQAHRGIWR